MSGSKSDYLEAKVLDHVFGATVYTPPATLYFALFTVAPTDAGGGTEVSAGGYARAAVTNNTTNFPAASGTSPTTKHNGTVIAFGTPSAAWGTVVAFGVFDALTGGNLLEWGTLTVSKTINNGDAAPQWNASDLSFTED